VWLCRFLLDTDKAHALPLLRTYLADDKNDERHVQYCNAIICPCPTHCKVHARTRV
jgi:hypothetical protein